MVLDTGHFAYRHGDNVDFMRSHQAHPVSPPEERRSADARPRGGREIPFAKAVSMDMFVEPAKGAVDFLEFRDLLRELDYTGFGMVEQDMFPAPFDKPLPIAKRTRAYLREIGIGSSATTVSPFW
jgi:inosose dehydratase